LKVVLPATPYDAKGLLKTAIRDDSPVVFLEDKMDYQVKGLVPESEYLLPFGVADVKRPGLDVTIIATSSMVRLALEAAVILAAEGIDAEVIDPRTLSPLDSDALIASAKKTSRVVIVDEGYRKYGITGEIAALIGEGAFYSLDSPIRRLGARDVPVPFSPVLEDLTVPTTKQIVESVIELCRK
jgi:pyruvate dehydrogenase E1 component beta subunit